MCQGVVERLLVSNGLGTQASRGMIDQLKLHILIIGNSVNGHLANRYRVALLVLPEESGSPANDELVTM